MSIRNIPGRRRLYPLALLAAVSIFGISECLANTATQAARSSARKRGYSREQTACFVPIFESYAARNRTGAWIAGGRRPRGDIYRHEVYAKCGVIR